MFQKRSGHHSAQEVGERCPVFLQFLDCLHQIWHQMPGEFEFNDKLITFLAEEVYNCKYGDFFFNCEQERLKNEVRDKTFTVWFAIDLQRDIFKNNFYVGLDKAQRIARLPIVEYDRLRYWREYFSKYTEAS
jgi:hypothetical protein